MADITFDGGARSRLGNYHLKNSEFYNYDPSQFLLEYGSSCIDETQLGSIQLYEHQRAEINQMRRVEANQTFIDKDFERGETRLGLLLDEPGTGKSYTILGHALTSEKPTIKTSFQCSLQTTLVSVSKETQTREMNTQIDTTIIIAPKHTYAQWKKYVSNMTNDYLSFRRCDAYFRKNIQSIGQYSIIIVHETIHNNIVFYLNYYLQRPVSRVVYDEADTIKIESQSMFPACFYWCVISDINFAQRNSVSETRYHKFGNNISENMRALLKDGLHASRITSHAISVGSSKAFIEHSTGGLPEPRWISVPVHINRATSILSTYEKSKRTIISQAAAGNAPLSQDRDGNVVRLIDIMTRKYEREAIMKEREAEQAETQNEAEHLNKEAEHNRNIAEEIRHKAEKRMEDGSCCVCLDEIEDNGNSVALGGCCMKMLCIECSNEWFKIQNQHKCPFCRTPHALNNLITKSEQDNSSSTYIYKKPDDAVVNIASQSNSCIIYCEMQDIRKIENGLINNNVAYHTISGDTNVEPILQNFRDGAINVVLLSGIHASRGMNMEFVDDLILTVEPSFKQQVIGRAQRIGRTKPLNVYTLNYHYQ